MDTKLKSGCPYGELPEPEPSIHKGKIIPMPQFASVVRRGGKVIRINGIPVDQGAEE